MKLFQSDFSKCRRSKLSLWRHKILYRLGLLEWSQKDMDRLNSEVDRLLKMFNDVYDGLAMDPSRDKARAAADAILDAWEGDRK